jgi:hypothetical protein
MDWLNAGFLVFFGVMIVGSALAFRRARARGDKHAWEQRRLAILDKSNMLYN